MTHRRTSTLILGMVTTFALATFVLSACGKSKETTGGDEGSDEIGDDSGFGQTPGPTDETSTQGPGGATTPGLSPSSDTPTPGIDNPAADSDPEVDPLAVYTNYNYGSSLLPIQDLLSRFKPFQPSTLPNPTVLSRLYCAFQRRYGSGYARKYDYVFSVFLDVLQRLPDSAAATTAARSLDNVDSEAARRALVEQFLRSKEHANLFVDIAYRTFLKKAPPAAQLNGGGYSGSLMSGHTQELQLIGILASNDYFVRGKRNVKKFINLAIKDVLARNAKAKDTNFYYRIFTKAKGGIAGRKKVAEGIVHSDEAFLKNADFLRVRYLHRGATAAEREAAVREKNAGKRRTQFAVDVLGGQEYYEQHVDRFGPYTRDGLCSGFTDAQLDNPFQ